MWSVYVALPDAQSREHQEYGYRVIVGSVARLRLAWSKPIPVFLSLEGRTLHLHQLPHGAPAPALQRRVWRSGEANRTQ